MSFLVVLVFSTVVSVMGQSTVQDSQCDNECYLLGNIEIQRLITMMEEMKRDMKDTNERSETSVMELESKVTDLIKQNNALEGTIKQLQAEIAELKSKNQTSSVDGDINYDCEDIRARGYLLSGVYEVNVNTEQTHRVYCEMTSDGKAWTRILHRQDNLTDFTYKKWIEYEAGFGDPQGSHWMGLIQMHKLTTTRAYKLKVDLEDWEGEKRFAEYSTFSVGAGSDNYRLSIDGYNGTAGDSMYYHNMMFTTIDQDNDQYGGNCARGTDWRTGGWWHNRCFHARLTGPYYDGGDVPFLHGIQWRGWRGGDYSYKVATMKVQRL